jgi:hypothetical protein
MPNEKRVKWIFVLLETRVAPTLGGGRVADPTDIHEIPARQMVVSMPFFHCPRVFGRDRSNKRFFDVALPARLRITSSLSPTGRPTQRKRREN